jgi:hypothetical protein
MCHQQRQKGRPINIRFFGCEDRTSENSVIATGKNTHAQSNPSHGWPLPKRSSLL